jgi:hypothetical protein
VVAILWARGERRAFHLPGGDGAVILGAGLWVMFLIFYRQLDKPDGRHEGPINTAIGVDWGIFVAFVLGAVLAFAGFRIRASHAPEPAADDAARGPAGAPEDGTEPVEWTTVPGRRRTGGPADEATTVVRRPDAGGAPDDPTTVPDRPRPPRDRGRPIDEDLSFEDPAEYRPPPRRRP